MNLQLLSSDIVRRVQHSPDSAHNLSCMVANLIREEMEREALHVQEQLSAKRLESDQNRRREN